MPLYEYRCPDCDHRFEVLQRLGAGSDEVTCPRCGREDPARQLSTFASSTSGGSAGASAAPAAGGGCGAGGFT